MSKITVAHVRTQVGELLEYSLETKKRNFLVSIPFPPKKHQPGTLPDVSSPRSDCCCEMSNHRPSNDR